MKPIKGIVDWPNVRDIKYKPDLSSRAVSWILNSHTYISLEQQFTRMKEAVPRQSNSD